LELVQDPPSLSLNLFLVERLSWPSQQQVQGHQPPKFLDIIYRIIHSRFYAMETLPQYFSPSNEFYDNLNFINSLIRLELGFTFSLSRWADSHYLVFDNNMRMYHNSVNTSA